jgi:hypothetical protein
MKEGIAEQAGAPIVAAIKQFKDENQRVPHSLDELVAKGYLPATWDQGLDDVEGHVQEVVKGKKWDDFLRYKAGEDTEWQGAGWNRDSGVSVDFSDWELRIDGPENKEKAHTTYGLAFCGIDGQWGTDDDTAVNQSPETPYDLASIWGGDTTTREAMRAKGELERMVRRIDDKVKALEESKGRAQDDLKDQEEKLRQMMDAKGLKTLDQVKSDTNANKRLQLVGETASRLKAIDAKRMQLVENRESIEIEIDRLKNQVEMAKLADSKEELAKLQQLLNSSRETVEREDSYFAKVSNEEAADQWFKENVR